MESHLPFDEQTMRVIKELSPHVPLHEIYLVRHPEFNRDTKRIHNFGEGRRRIFEFVTGPLKQNLLEGFVMSGRQARILLYHSGVERTEDASNYLRSDLRILHSARYGIARIKPPQLVPKDLERVFNTTDAFEQLKQLYAELLTTQFGGNEAAFMSFIRQKWYRGAPEELQSMGIRTPEEIGQLTVQTLMNRNRVRFRNEDRRLIEVFSVHEPTIEGVKRAFGLYDQEYPPYGDFIRIAMYSDRGIAVNYRNDRQAFGYAMKMPKGQYLTLNLGREPTQEQLQQMHS
jgi:hypothetical protein